MSIIDTEPNNWPKLIIACVTIICVSLLMAVDKISEAGGIGIIGVTSGYILNNGLRAVQKRRASNGELVERRRSTDNEEGYSYG